jgi:hypothetical protein
MMDRYSYIIILRVSDIERQGEKAIYVNILKINERAGELPRFRPII